MTQQGPIEPALGLPEPLPAGESLLWQGRPSWWRLSCRALGAVYIGSYFLALAAWKGYSAYEDFHSYGAAAMGCAVTLLQGCCVLGILLLIGWAAARATVYSITTRRVVIRHGIALSMSLNVPFHQIESAALCVRRGGVGDIALKLVKSQRVGYFVNWPHVRPRFWAHPQPMLRALHDPSTVAAVLSQALRLTLDTESFAPAAGAPAVVEPTPSSVAA